MDCHDFDGPHFDSSLIGPDGRLARLHKGGGASVPKPNKKLEAMQLQLMQAQLRQAGQKIEMPQLPAAPEPAPPPPPPPTASSIDVMEAGTEAKRQALKRSGYQSTLFAGESGGYGSKLGGQGSLLGGS